MFDDNICIAAAQQQNKIPDFKLKLSRSPDSLETRLIQANIIIRSTLDSPVVSSAYRFKDKLLARQVEMQELIR